MLLFVPDYHFDHEVTYGSYAMAAFIINPPLQKYVAYGPESVVRLYEPVPTWSRWTMCKAMDRAVLRGTCWEAPIVSRLGS